MLALGTLTRLQFLIALLSPLVVIAVISLRGSRPRSLLTEETAGRIRTPTVVNIGLRSWRQWDFLCLVRAEMGPGVE